MDAYRDVARHDTKCLYTPRAGCVATETTTTWVVDDWGQQCSSALSAYFQVRILTVNRRPITCIPLLLIFVGLSGCSRDISEPVTGKFVENPIDPWIITNLNDRDKTPSLLWNGQIGFRFWRGGGAKGQPFFSVDEYDTTGEEKIRSMDSPLPNGFLVDGKLQTISSDSSYRQTLDMRTSELTSHWTSQLGFTIDCITVLHPIKRMISERWTLTGDTKGHTVDFDLGQAGSFGKEYMLATDITVGSSHMKGKLLATRAEGSNLIVDYTLSLGRSPNWLAIQKSRGNDPAEPASWYAPPAIETFDQLDAEARKIWVDRWKTDIEIDGPAEDQQAVRSFLFYLRSAIDPAGGMSISPFGLSNKMYNGHVFWDADTWVFPALMLLDPQEAVAIPLYRHNTLLRTRLNSAVAKPGLNEIPSALRFAWESSTSGTDVAPMQMRDELHVSGDVAWCMAQASDLWLMRDEETAELIKNVGQGFSMASKSTPGKPLELNHVMSPDENHVGDNDLYTNLLAQWTTKGGRWGKDFDSMSSSTNFKLPHDDKSFLTYDNDQLRGYKQAAAVLSIYPLQYPVAEMQANVMMDRFADKVTKNGPAMSDSVHALIWARLGEKEKAYKTWQESWIPFTRQPLLLFSEKRVKPTTYFTTGAAGSLQTVLFGFLGFRLDSVSEQDAAWSKKLEGNSWLSIKPNLPPQWKSVKVKNFTVHGRHYTLTATHRPSGPDAAEVIQGD